MFTVLLIYDSLTFAKRKPFNKTVTFFSTPEKPRGAEMRFGTRESKISKETIVDQHSMYQIANFPLFNLDSLDRFQSGCFL